MRTIEEEEEEREVTRRRKRRFEREKRGLKALTLQNLQREVGLSGRVLSQTEHTL